MPSIPDLLNELKAHIGIIQQSSRHRAMIDAYNRIQPIPVGYLVKYTDDWCDAFVTYIADRIGISQQIGRECGVERHRSIMQRRGLWVGKTTPKTGDIIFFDWDGGGFCDHIGFVEKVNEKQVFTIEGNSMRQVRRAHYDLNDWRIVGYGRPAYQEASAKTMTNQELAKIALQVIRGEWGNGAERVRRLVVAGYDAVIIQKRVNQHLLDGFAYE